VPVPPDNPQTAAKVGLGAQLYFDPRLSADNSISCATCHDPSMAWANDNATDTGIKGRVGNRNSGTILDTAYMTFQFWDGRATSLEDQALGPIHNPIEMGETLENVVQKLNAIPGTAANSRPCLGPTSPPTASPSLLPPSRGPS
jgi:cytochrome c peroxidase